LQVRYNSSLYSPLLTVLTYHHPFSLVSNTPAEPSESGIGGHNGSGDDSGMMVQSTAPSFHATAGGTYGGVKGAKTSVAGLFSMSSRKLTRTVAPSTRRRDPHRRLRLAYTFPQPRSDLQCNRVISIIETPSASSFAPQQAARTPPPSSPFPHLPPNPVKLASPQHKAA